MFGNNSNITAQNCGICDKVCPTKAALNFHVRKSHGIMRFTCVICGKDFGSRNDLKRHASSHMKTEKIDPRVDVNHKSFEDKFLPSKKPKCPSCSKRFATRRNVLRHLRNNSCESNGNTEIKQEAFSTSNEELIINKEGQRNKCKKCGIVFASNSGMHRHVKRVHEGVKKYKCKPCGKSFTAKGSLDYHNDMTHHVSTKNFNCEKCPMYFTTKKAWKTHLISAHESTPLYCDLCEKGPFVWKSNLARHKRINHRRTQEDEKYECSICFKVFRDKRKLNKHMKVRHEEIEENLDEFQITSQENAEEESTALKIDQVYSENPEDAIIEESLPMKIKREPESSQAKEKHDHMVTIHEDLLDEENSQIDSTDYDIKQEEIVLEDEVHENVHENAVHESVHENVQDLAIENDDEEEESIFLESTPDETLTNDVHEKTQDVTSKNIVHEDIEDPTHDNPENKLKCHKCGKSFTAKCTLNRHMMSVHEGIKPFRCLFCFKSFTRNFTLKAHILKAHPKGKASECAFCSLVFSNEDELMSHLIAAHKSITSLSIEPLQPQTPDLQHNVVEIPASEPLLQIQPQDFQCDVCGTCFGSQSVMNIHKNIVHGSEKANVVCVE